MSAITLATLDDRVQRKLRNLVNSPLDQTTRVASYNDVIAFLQSKSNWNFTKRVATFEYLNKEVDYSLVNALLITDFKQIKDLRFINDSDASHTKEFEEVDGNRFSVAEGQGRSNNEFCFEDRDGDKILRILSDLGRGDTIADDMTDLTTGRTWASDTTNSDATTLAADTTRPKVGSGCLKFDITVSQSANNRAVIYTSTSLTTALDLSDILNKGHARLWLGLHSLTAAQLALITSVQFIWGSESGVTPATRAHYWSRTATTTATGGTFKATYNRMTFDWASATKTGSPDEAAIKYFEIVINFSSSMTNATNIRVDQIKFFDPKEMELVYYSSNFVSLSGVWQENFTTSTVNTNEQLLMDNRHLRLFENLALRELFPMKEKNEVHYLRVVEEIKAELPVAILLDGNPITREESEFQVEGNSRGRDDGANSSQW